MYFLSSYYLIVYEAMQRPPTITRSPQTRVDHLPRLSSHTRMPYTTSYHTRSLLTARTYACKPWSPDQIVDNLASPYTSWCIIMIGVVIRSMNYWYIRTSGPRSSTTRAELIQHRAPPFRVVYDLSRDRPSRQRGWVVPRFEFSSMEIHPHINQRKLRLCLLHELRTFVVRLIGYFSINSLSRACVDNELI